MTAEETIKRVREIMKENKIPYDERMELEMAMIYSQAKVDAAKESLETFKKMETK